MARLTIKKPCGEWSVRGISFEECTPEMYGALCKLLAYEESGLEPDDLDKEFEKHTFYKVFYGKTCSDMKTLFCQSKEEAQTIADTLEQAGFQVTVNVWGWKGFVEV